MASTASQNYISLQQLRSCGYAMIATTSAFALARIGIRISRPKALAAEDILVSLAYASFLTMTILYIRIAPVLYKLSDVISGKAAPYTGLEADGLDIIKTFFANTLLLWCILWFVKGSLLSLYRKLLGSNKIYFWVWWGIVGFCVLTFIGCVISHLTSCSSIKAWFTVGGCATPRDSRAQIISLYYAFTVDVLSDLMIMALPIALIWNLKLPMSKKAGIMALFCVGIVAIAAAIVRVVSIGVRAKNSTPSSTWLAFWGILESGIAVIIGTAPGLYTTARQVHTSKKESRYAGYSGNGYLRHTGDVDLKSSIPTTSNMHSSMSAEEDDRAILQPGQISSSTPVYPKSTTLVAERQVGEDIEMLPRDKWR